MAGAPPGCQLVGRGRARAGCVAGRRAGAPTGVCAGVAHLAGSGASAPARAGFGCARRRALRAIIASTRRPARLLAEAAGPAGFLQGLCCHLCGSRPEQRLRLVSLGQHPGYTLNVATDAGETRQLDLPDGSHVALNFNSTLQVRYPRRRELVLNQGEGYFDVAPDARRPSPWMRAKAASPWSARPSTCAMRRMKSSSRSCTAACGCSPTATKPAPS